MTAFGNTTTKLQAASLIVEPQISCNDSYNLRSGHPKSLEIELVLPNLIQPNILCAGSRVRTYFFTNYIGTYLYKFNLNSNLPYSLVQVPVQVTVEVL